MGVNINLQDLNGLSIFKENIQTQGGDVKTYPVNHLPSGIYL